MNLLCQRQTFLFVCLVFSEFMKMSLDRRYTSKYTRLEHGKLVLLPLPCWKKFAQTYAHSWHPGNVIWFYNYHFSSCSRSSRAVMLIFALGALIVTVFHFFVILLVVREQRVNIAALFLLLLIFVMFFHFSFFFCFSPIDIFVDFIFPCLLCFSCAHGFLIRFSKSARINNSWISKACG